MKDEMSMMEESYANSADELQDQSDSMLPTISGRFSKQALNGLVASFNKALEAAGFPGDYPTFDGNQTTLPMEFVRGLMMMSDAAEETGSGVSLTLDGITDDRGLVLVAGKLDAMAKSEAFKKAMSEPEGTELEVEISAKPTDEDMFMERA